jgi:hypothetical protein
MVLGAGQLMNALEGRLGDRDDGALATSGPPPRQEQPEMSDSASQGTESDHQAVGTYRATTQAQDGG